LQEEAKDELQRLAARLVLWKASYVARSVIDFFEINPALELAAPETLADSSGDEDVDRDGTVDDVWDDPVDEDMIEDLCAFGVFLATGNAFQDFRQRLQAFTQPKIYAGETSGELVPLEEQGQEAPAIDAGLEQSYVNLKPLSDLLVTLGWLEPPLNAGRPRLRWHCVRRLGGWSFHGRH
jgi:hypothetical protein